MRHNTSTTSNLSLSHLDSHQLRGLICHGLVLCLGVREGEVAFEELVDQRRAVRQRHPNLAAGVALPDGGRIELKRVQVDGHREGNAQLVVARVPLADRRARVVHGTGAIQAGKVLLQVLHYRWELLVALHLVVHREDGVLVGRHRCWEFQVRALLRIAGSLRNYKSI